MKSAVSHPVVRPVRGTLTGRCEFRVDPRQKDFWEKSAADLGFGNDMAAYYRFAIDRSIALDFQTQDPNWQKFLVAVSKQAKAILGYELKDSLEGRATILKIYSDVQKK